MNKRTGWALSALIILSLSVISWIPVQDTATNSSNSVSLARLYFKKYQSEIFNAAGLQASGLNEDVFDKALTGFLALKAAKRLAAESAILTVIDYSKSSCEKRMWIINLINRSVVLNTIVAHGQGSGDDMATQFSDNTDSHQSSLGFFITDQVYYGKHGRSLKLDGLDSGFNANARARDIVIHGAPYVSEKVIAIKGRLGLSYGCPAVPVNLADKVIDKIKNKTLIFINGTDAKYNSKYLDEDLAANYLQSSNAEIELANL